MRKQTRFRWRRKRKKRLGRPPGPNAKRRVAHRARKTFTRRRVLHVALRVRSDVPKLRRWRLARAIRKALVGGCAKPGFSICQFSIQSNHLHLVCEADHHVALARGMQGFGVRAAKAINKAIGRKGSVFEQRYSATPVTNRRQMRNTLCYVLHNARRHGAKFAGVDVFSSARFFDGWKTRPALGPPETDSIPVARPKTRLLSKDWRRLGLIGLDETPKR